MKNWTIFIWCVMGAFGEIQGSALDGGQKLHRTYEPPVYEEAQSSKSESSKKKEIKAREVSSDVLAPKRHNPYTFTDDSKALEANSDVLAPTRTDAMFELGYSQGKAKNIDTKEYDKYFKNGVNLNLPKETLDKTVQEVKKEKIQSWFPILLLAFGMVFYICYKLFSSTKFEDTDNKD